MRQFDLPIRSQEKINLLNYPILFKIIYVSIIELMNSIIYSINSNLMSSRVRSVRSRNLINVGLVKCKNTTYSGHATKHTYGCDYMNGHIIFTHFITKMLKITNLSSLQDAGHEIKDAFYEQLQDL